ncbi:YidH family protein [Micrococcus luteus]
MDAAETPTAPRPPPTTAAGRPGSTASWRAGEEPDPRFTLANERTFLAWVRTALALLAGGVAVEAFTGALFAPPVRVVLSTVLLVLAALLALGAGARWLRVERAMRRGRPLPLPLIVPVLAGGVVLAVVVLLAAVVLPRG